MILQREEMVFSYTEKKREKIALFKFIHSILDRFFFFILTNNININLTAAESSSRCLCRYAAQFHLLAAMLLKLNSVSK